MSDGIGHCQDRQAERERDSDKADPEVWKTGREHGGAAAPRTSQNVPKNSANTRRDRSTPIAVTPRATVACFDEGARALTRTWHPVVKTTTGSSAFASERLDLCQSCSGDRNQCWAGCRAEF